MSRWKAAGIHLLISLFIAAAAIAAVVLVMYPQPYTNSAGAGRMLRVLIGVQLTLGPLLTLIVFKHDKPGLKFDIAVLTVLQVAALGYGLHTIGQARPVFLAHNIDRFSLVQASAITDQAIARAAGPFDRRSWTGPMLVGTKMPTGEVANEILFSALAGRDIDTMPQYYVGYTSARDRVGEGGTALAELAAQSPGTDVVVRRWLGERRIEKFVYYPLQARQGYHTLVLDKVSLQPAGVLPIDPW